MNWDKISGELKKPLSADAIKPPAPGKYGEYVDGKHVIDEANRIFGFGNWSYSVTRLEMCSEQTVKDSKGKPQYRVGYICTVRVDVGDAYREGAAGGSGMGNANSMADHHESAVKEAETAALKRALRTFGNTFGLALYEKDKVKREVSDTKWIEPLERDLIKALEGAAALFNLNNILANQKFITDLKRVRDASQESAARVDVVIDQRKQELSQETTS